MYLTNTCLVSHFNSIKVQLKHDYQNPDNEEEDNFNSIKVQLKQQILNSIKSGRMTFQFHKGTIKTTTLVLSFLHLSISIP